jgi:DNA polymerase-3 subunit alpha
MAALLSASAGETEKVALYAADARSLGVPVLPPDINSSGWDFEIEEVDGKPAIRFGLGAIKNLGHTATEQVLEERRLHGTFKDLNDFARRVDLRGVGKRGLECLIKVGALDSFGGRFALLASLERISGISANHFRAIESGRVFSAAPQALRRR